MSFAATNLVGFGSIAAGAAAGANDPISILGSKLKAWYDHSDLSTLWQDTAGTTAVAADSDPCARVDDKSGNGYNKLQSDTGLRPLWRNNGGIDRLVYASGAYMAVANPGFPLNGLHYFAVVDPPDGTEGRVMNFNTDGGSGSRDQIEVYWHSSVPRWTARNLDDVNVPLESFSGLGLCRIEVRIENGVSVTMRRNSDELTDTSFANLSATHNDDYLEAASHYFSLIAGVIDFSEVIIADSPTSGEAADIRTYLDDKWGLP